jgi:4-hydroxy-3-methylbut-2-enyl diphosphate reductase
MGFASAGGIVIPEINQKALSEIPEDREICVVAQTTQEPDTFNRVVEALSKPGIKLHVYNTICDSTRRRQDEVSALAQAVDVVLVVGGKGSGNTQRLVKVAEAQGVPAFHVETDEEVDSAVFADVGTIGVTAGASTPNWQIRRVTEKLKRIGISRSFGPLRRIRRLVDVFVMTYGWAALAGGGLTAACMILQKTPPTLFPVLVTMLFVFSMHLLNRIQERAGAVRFNTPEIAQFYAGHKRLLTGLGAVSSLAAFFLSMQMGFYAGIIMAAILVMGRMYTVPLPGRLFPGLKWRSLKDLPGSKTPLVAFGWAFAAAVLPVIDTKGWFFSSTIAVFLFAAGMVFWRTALSDLLDIQGDRIVGRETIPILIGIKRTRSLLVSMLVTLGALIIVFTGAGVLPACALLLLINVGIFALFFGIYRSRHLVDRILFESIMDGNLILAGILMLLFCAAN